MLLLWKFKSLLRNDKNDDYFTTLNWHEQYRCLGKNLFYNNKYFACKTRLCDLSQSTAGHTAHYASVKVTVYNNWYKAKLLIPLDQPLNFILNKLFILDFYYT